VSGPELYQSVSSAKHLVTEKPPPAGGGFEQQESLYIAYQKPSILFYIAYHSPLYRISQKDRKTPAFTLFISYIKNTKIIIL
jgi:hypothetical protein